MGDASATPNKCGGFPWLKAMPFAWGDLLGLAHAETVPVSMPWTGQEAS